MCEIVIKYFILVVKTSSKQKAGLMSVKLIIQVEDEWSVSRALIGRLTIYWPLIGRKGLPIHTLLPFMPHVVSLKKWVKQKD